MSALVLEIDPSAERPVFRQITDGLRGQLIRGVIQPGSILPSVRELAARLGVHFNTVAEAYRQLEREGFVEVRRRRGTVVLDRGVPHLDEEAAEALDRELMEELTALLDRFRAAGLDAQRLARVVQQVVAKQV